MTERFPSSGLPSAQGLYDPRNEHDGCGIGFVVNIEGRKSHDIVLKGVQILINLTHRGACGCDPETGDGAGILIQIPHAFFERECSRLGFTLPAAGEYGVGMVFLPVERSERILCEGLLEKIAREEGLTVLGWRDTPIDGNTIGRLARGSQPYIEQVFLRRGPGMDQDALERKLYVVRKRVEAAVAASDFREKGYFYLPSLSSRTIVYKGLLLAPQIMNFYKELAEPDVVSALCLVHQRFSTNTFPSWQLAHPYRFVCHNGEINTLRGNVKLLEASGISIETLDLSEVLGRISRMKDDDAAAVQKLQSIQKYVSTDNIPHAALLKMAKLGAVVDDWMKATDLQISAVQCWTSLEENLGVVPCTVMSMMSDSLLSSACEVDVCGVLGMHALQLASETPSALLDWNNNYGSDPNKAVCFHCSNLPKHFFREVKMDYQAIIAGTVGKENTFGTCVGLVKSGAMCFARFSTDDGNGRIRGYTGSGRFTDDPLETFGGAGVVEIPGLQKLLRYICENGFEHHVAANFSSVAPAVHEAATRYLHWDMYAHAG